MPEGDETKLLLNLLLHTRSNQRRICIGLAIAVACTTAVLLDFFWRPAAHRFLQFLPIVGLCVTGGVSMWLVARLARENAELRKQSTALAKKLRML